MSIRATMTAGLYNGHGAVAIELETFSSEEMQTILRLMEDRPLVLRHVSGNEFYLRVFDDEESTDE